jgi:hypothetical protein
MEQEALSARALAEADPQTREAAELFPETLSLYQTLWCKNHIRKLLKQQAAA